MLTELTSTPAVTKDISPTWGDYSCQLRNRGLSCWWYPALSMGSDAKLNESDLSWCSFQDQQKTVLEQGASHWGISSPASSSPCRLKQLLIFNWAQCRSMEMSFLNVRQIYSIIFPERKAIMIRVNKKLPQAKAGGKTRKSKVCSPMCAWAKQFHHFHLTKVSHNIKPTAKSWE